MGPDCRAWCCCCRTATRARARSTRARAWSVSCSWRRRQHARGQLHHARAVLPPAAPPGARRPAAPAGGDDAEEPAAPAGRHSTIDELANGAFHRVIDDPALPGDRDAVTELVLCSGKVYYDIASFEERTTADHIAVARVELLYPFPEHGAQRADGELPEPGAGRLGAGGAAQHGRAGLHAPANGGDPSRGRRLRLRRSPAPGRSRRGVHGSPTARSRHASSEWPSTSRRTYSSPASRISAP